MSEDPEARGEIKRDGRARVRLNSKHDSFLTFKKKKPYLKFLIAQNCIKKDLEIYVFFT